VLFSQEAVHLQNIADSMLKNPLNILFLIFVGDILATGLYYRGLHNVPATLATIFELTFPLTGFILDYMIYDVTPSPMKVVAALVILMSIVILPYCHFIEEKVEKNKLIA
jgi:drug/metabolite transporter (DMT)-like permease